MKKFDFIPFLYRGSRSKNTKGDPIIPKDELRFNVNDVAPIPPGLAPDNLLLAESVKKGLTVSLDFPSVSMPDIGDTVQLSIDGKKIGLVYQLDDYKETDVLELKIPAEELITKEGSHSLSYYLAYDMGESGAYGPDLNFVVDLSAPGNEYFLAAPVFSTEVISEGVTPDKLTVIEGKQYLKGKIAGYQGMAAGDKIQAYIDSESFHAADVAVGDVNNSLEALYPRELFEKVGDGERTITYRATDRAGNQSDVSEAAKLSVILKGAIDDLEAPDVPLFSDGLITDADARTPVEVHIPGNEKVLSGDNVIVHWGTSTLPPVMVRTGDVGQEPLLKIRIPYHDIFEQWDESIGNTPVDVWYEVKRGAIAAGSSPETRVLVNLELAGGADPDPETPINENLISPTILSSSGKQNEIPVEDSLTDATYIVSWVNAQTPAKPVFKENDVIKAFFGSTPLTPYTITDADVTEAKNIEIVLPASAITSEGTGNILAHYEVTRVISGENSNTSISPEQIVVVKSAGHLPGGGELGVGRYTKLNSKGNISRKEAMGGVPFEIPLYAHKTIGDEITITFESFGARDQNLTKPLATVTVTHIVNINDVNGVTLISDVVTEKAIDATLGDVDPKGVGRGRTIYTIKNSSGSVESKPAIVAIDIRG